MALYEESVRRALAEASAFESLVVSLTRFSRDTVGDGVTLEAPRIQELVGASVGVAVLNRKFTHKALNDREVRVVLEVFRQGVDVLRRMLPEVARDIERQVNLAVLAAGLAKGAFNATINYAFPPTTGTLGVAWLFPQAIRYATTPSPTAPAYTSYKPNSWDIDVTAGTPAYIFGGPGATEFYRASPTPNARAFILVFENGLIQVGTAPAVEQFHLISEARGDLGAYTVQPLVEIPIEKNLAVYQIPTPLGALLIDHNQGVKFSFLPRVTGTITLKLLGLVFYEIDFFKTFKWVA
jgi:type II secretory pathway pseudopilin PulG